MLNIRRLALALAACSGVLSDFGSQIAEAMKPDPAFRGPNRTHYHGHNTRGIGVELNHCWRCGKAVNFFKRHKGRRHLCKAPWQPMPRAGWRVENGVEVPR